MKLNTVPARVNLYGVPTSKDPESISVCENVSGAAFLLGDALTPPVLSRGEDGKDAEDPGPGVRDLDLLWAEFDDRDAAELLAVRARRGWPALTERLIRLERMVAEARRLAGLFEEEDE